MESTPKPKPRRGRPPLNRPPRPKVVKKNGRPKKPEIGILDDLPGGGKQALESKHSFVNKKVADLTPEQREIRREYFRIANRHYRARKKLEREALEMT
jgi:hypothetical protein